MTGAAVAFHLATGHKADAVDITIFEPRAEIGRGLAYDTRDPVHRINVPATRMSILPGDPEHFSRWMETTGSVADDEAAFRADGNVFPRRASSETMSCPTFNLFWHQEPSAISAPR